MSINTRQRPATTIALIVALLCVPGLAQAGKAEASKEALDQVQSRIESLKQKLDSTQEAHSDAADALKKSELAISEANRKLFELDLEQKANHNTLQSLQQQTSRLGSTIAYQQQLLGKELYQQYLNGQHSYLQIVLTQHDPSAVTRELQYFSYVARARADLISGLKTNLGRVATLNEQTSAALKKINDLKGLQEKQRMQLESEKAARKTMLVKLASQIKSQRGEISKLRRDEKRLSDLVERLARIVPAQPKPPKNHKDAGRSNNDVPTKAFSGSGFAMLKGRLHLPVRGTIANRFGTLREDSGISWKGLFIKAGDGEDVKSVADGTVVFADWLRGFGNLMIIDHGDGFMSLYGNNQALLRKVGDAVTAGDSVATVGNSGGNEEAGLYFELRRQGQPFDPLSWCVVK
ncbi:murein hydrolase activator EnvC precursor [mine drainage metagenome]|uniref:Murein hydrolase activator EnvC n=1 Tax=mine drainage metagenome TaxID=410659 RepID=A0A1J5QAA2_9ZZZZ